MRFAVLPWLPSGFLHLLWDNRSGKMFKAIQKLWGNGWWQCGKYCFSGLSKEQLQQTPMHK